jgi:hypothetical protein
MDAEQYSVGSCTQRTTRQVLAAMTADARGLQLLLPSRLSFHSQFPPNTSMAWKKGKACIVLFSFRLVEVKDGYMKLKTLAVGTRLNIPKCENMFAKLQKSDLKNSDNSFQRNILFTKNASLYNITKRFGFL